MAGDMMIQKETLQLGLIGAGRIGRIHAENAALNVPGCRLTRIADINLSAARACGAKLGVERVHDDALGVIEADDVDAVLVCSATDTHVGLIEACAKAKKHVFCEKPLSLDLASIDHVIACAEEAGIKLMVGFNRRFDPAFSHVKNQILAGTNNSRSIVAH